jgi:hypothetical protein
VDDLFNFRRWTWSSAEAALSEEASGRAQLFVRSPDRLEVGSFEKQGRGFPAEGEGSLEEVDWLKLVQLFPSLLCFILVLDSNFYSISMKQWDCFLVGIDFVCDADGVEPSEQLRKPEDDVRFSLKELRIVDDDCE